MKWRRGSGSKGPDSRPAAEREPFHEAFLAQFNELLRKLRADGKLDEIVEAYMREMNSGTLTGMKHLPEF